MIETHGDKDFVSKFSRIKTFWTMLTATPWIVLVVEEAPTDEIAPVTTIPEED